MNTTFRQSMGSLHTWAGLSLGWLLYFIFVTGSAGFFEDEISQWMQPELPAIDYTISKAKMLEIVEERRRKLSPTVSGWAINFPTRRSPFLLFDWWDVDGEGSSLRLNPQTGEALNARATGGGHLLNEFHFRLHYLPVSLAYWTTSICAMFMLVSLISGILIHKKIFKDFFMFRPGKKQLSWLDMHTKFTVFSLPFLLMITYSGLLKLMFMTMPAGLIVSYGDGDKFEPGFREMFNYFPPKSSSNIPAQLIPLSTVFSDAVELWGVENIASVNVNNFGDANAYISITKTADVSKRERNIYSGVSGKILHIEESGRLSVTFYKLLLNLHGGLFAGSLLRWLYFMSGLMGAGMVATGLNLWAVKRKIRAEKLGKVHKGLALVESLNVGTIVGLPIAIAIYFWANRLIPVSFEDRAEWEVHALFITLGLTLVYPVFRSVQRTWIELLGIAALLYTLLPILNFFTTDRHLGISIPQGDWVMAGFDLTVMMFGAVFGVIAWKVHRRG